MICSDCSKKVRPIVALDIDGTMGMYHEHFLAMATEYIGLQVEWDSTVDGDFSDALGIDKATYRQIKLAYRQGGFKRWMPARRGIPQMTQMLLDQDVEKWITTTRPYLRLDQTDPDTRFWLEQQSISYDALLYDEDKYQVLAERVDKSRVVAILDDLPEQVIAAAESFNSDVPLMILTPWNRPWVGRVQDLGIEIVCDLYEAREVITRRLEKWNFIHG